MTRQSKSSGVFSGEAVSLDIARLSSVCLSYLSLYVSLCTSLSMCLCVLSLSMCLCVLSLYMSLTICLSCISTLYLSVSHLSLHLSLSIYLREHLQEWRWALVMRWVIDRHIYVSCVTRINESRHTKWLLSESCHTYDWVTSHTDESWLT